MVEKISEVNPELFPLVESGKLSSGKVLNLIQLKDLVDRFSTKPFIEDEKVLEIQNKTGVKPDILTWGDYFQTEVGSRFFDKSDSEFEKIIETIRFDLVSSHLIFSSKADFYKDQIRGEALISKSIEPSYWTFEDEETIHLEILLEYFENMGLGEKPLSTQDRIWYESFDLKKEII